MLDKRIKLMDKIFKITVVFIFLEIIIVLTMGDKNSFIYSIKEVISDITFMAIFMSMGFSKMYKSIENTSENIAVVDKHCKITSIIGAILDVVIFVVPAPETAESIILTLYIIGVLILGNKIKKERVYEKKSSI